MPTPIDWADGGFKGMIGTPTVLIVTGPVDIHADAMVMELNRRNIPVLRFHPEDFPATTSISIEVREEVVTGEIRTEHHSALIEDIAVSWYRRPRAPQVSDAMAEGAREFSLIQAGHALRALYSALDTIWINSPDALRIAEVKTLQLARAASVGLATPATLLSNDPEAADRFRRSQSGQRCAAKAPRVEGSFYESEFRFPLTKIWNGGDADAVRLAPTIFQSYVSKATELRCVVIGELVFTARLDPPPGSIPVLDWREIPHEELRQEPYDLPMMVRDSLVTLVKSFHLDFASADLILTPDDEYVFIELNPNGQWLWLEFETQMPLVAAMGDLMEQRVRAFQAARQHLATN